LYKINKTKNFLINKENLAEIYIRIKFSNIFITLTDSKHKVIVCKTAGSAGLKGSKKRKTTTQTVETIVSSLANYFKQYNINEIKLFLRCRVSTHIFTLIRYLLVYNIIINSISLTMPQSYTRNRKRNARRR
jgi:ribosomal protein S11